MAGINSLLEAANRFQDSRPLTSNAQDLFMKGHITSDEYESIAKGEAITTNSPHITRGKELYNMLAQPISQPTNDLPIGYYNTCIKRFVTHLEQALELWIPNQIDHVVIKASIDKDPEISPSVTSYMIRFKLIDVKKETAQQIATRVPLEWSCFKGDEEEDKLAWRYIDQNLETQFTMIILNLIRAIRTGAEIA